MRYLEDKQLLVLCQIYHHAQDACGTRGLAHSGPPTIQLIARYPLPDHYVNEIYAYMRYLEDKQSISEEYLSHVKSTIMPKMRVVLVD